LLFLISTFLLIASCETSDDSGIEEKENESSYTEYFYPTDSLVPFIYVFQNVNKPLDEKVHRIYRLESPQDTSLVVEYYNSNLTITEGYTHSIKDDFKVTDHMIVDGDGKKRKAKLSSNTFFPTYKDEQIQFVSDFPSHLDSITMIYQSKRRFLEKKTVKVLGKDVPAIIVEDSVKVLFVNPFNKKSSSQKVMIARTFAKGYGMVRWSANNEEIVYELDKILSNEWWEEFGQSPQINP